VDSTTALVGNMLFVALIIGLVPVAIIALILMTDM